MKKMLCVLLFALLLCGCGKEPPAETTEAPVTTTAAPETTLPVTTAEPIETTSAPETTAAPDITVEPVQMETVDALPSAAENAILTVSAVGGNPSFLVFEDGLTYYVRTFSGPTSLDTLPASKCTLSLPEGCTDGVIVGGSSGAGSGEIILTVSAQRDGKNVCFDYLFYCDDLAEPIYIWEKEGPVYMINDWGVTLQTVELPLPEGMYCRAFSYDDRYTVYLRYSRADNGARGEYRYNALYVVDADAGEVAYTAETDAVSGFAFAAYTEKGVVLYAPDDGSYESGKVRFAISLTEENGIFSHEEISIGMYPIAQQRILSPDGRYTVYGMQDDAVNHGGIDVQGPDGIKRICNNVMLEDDADLGDVTGYGPVGFLDEKHFVYWINGWEWPVGYGICNVETGEKTEVRDGTHPAAVFDGGFFGATVRSYVVEQYHRIAPDGTRTLLASRDAADGVFRLRSDRYYTFENSMWCAYRSEDGASPAYSLGRGVMQVSFYSADFGRRIAEIIYPDNGALGKSLLVYGDKVTVVLPTE